MGLLESQLREYLDADAFVAPCWEWKKQLRCIRLREEKNASSELLLIGVPQNLIILRSDTFMPLFLERSTKNKESTVKHTGRSFFKEHTGASSRADFILLDELEKHIVFLELKGSTETAIHIQEQLVGSRSVLEYIRHVVAHQLEINVNSFLGSEYSLHFAGACNTSFGLNKQPTKYRTAGRGDCARNFLRFSGTTELHYHQLCAK